MDLPDVTKAPDHGPSVYERDGAWYWCDETWAESAPCATREQAVAEQDAYCATVLGPECGLIAEQAPAQPFVGGYTAETWDDLCERVRAASEAMTPQDREIQALDFSYGQLVCDGAAPRRAIFWNLAASRPGYDGDRFVAWALTKKWADVDDNGVALGPLRRWRGLTWVGWLNKIVFRWFFIRLQYTVEYDNTISKWGVIVRRPWRW